MKRQHCMPFGAELLEPGLTRFRLWAPAARELAVLIATDGREDRLSMERLSDGWWEKKVPVPASTRYQFLANGERAVPDPASRWNPGTVHGASEVVDPKAFRWDDAGWRGRPWEEAVIYELHVGTFSPEGTFAGVETRLDYLLELGVTAIELMPVGDFSGDRGWGYDGVLPYAPARAYGRPEHLKQLIAAAHARGIMVLIDVVYNHFGPDGNYLHLYAPQFFTDRHPTPWGAGINFDDQSAQPVREFFVHNALYWLEEFHADGLRLDAVHAIRDNSTPHILIEIADAIRAGPGRERSIHLVLENDCNETRYLRRAPDGRVALYDAQWNDDMHHAFHVLLTGESDGYYSDYAADPTRLLGRSLAEGFAYQGERSQHRGGEPRGEPSAGLPPAAFVSFLQTHDQVGNRAFGERLAALADQRALRAATVAWLLAPAPPMLFMGEEFGAVTPFLYFCDFTGDLATAVRDGRRREFARFARFADSSARDAIPDPNDPRTFRGSKLDWDSIKLPAHGRWLTLYRQLLTVRRERLAPLLAGMREHSGRFQTLAPGAVACEWRLGDGSLLSTWVNLSGHEVSCPRTPSGECLLCEPPDLEPALAAGRLPAHSAGCYLEPQHGR